MPKPVVSMGVATITKLRQTYLEQWHREWPFNNNYLLTLWREARAAHDAVGAKTPPPAVFGFCLDLMRECHSFE